MLKTLSLILLALVIAVGGGAGSVWIVLENRPAVGAMSSGPWTANPKIGTRDADPYTRAHFVREGGIPLGRAEGIRFTAQHDSAGATLLRQCTYRLESPVPAARFWTLYATNPARALLPPTARRLPALHAQMILRRPDNGFTITISRHPAPGNWLPVGGEGPMRLNLTLFDTPVSADLPVGQLTLPQIVRVACDA